MSVRSEDTRPDALQLSDIECFGERIPGGFYVYLADDSLQIIYANSNVFRIFGCDTPEEFVELTGGTFCGLVHPEDFEAVQRSIEQQLSENSDDKLDFVEYRIIRKDGEVRYVDDYGHFAHLDGYGDVYYVFISDITDKRRSQEEHFHAQLALEQEKRANEIKSSLLLNISNDMHTPLDVITEFSRQARNHLEDTERLRADLNSVDAASQRIEHLMESLLDMSVDEFGRIAVRPEPCDLAGQIHYVVELFRAQAQQRRLTLEEDVELPDESVLADTHRLHGVLGSLLGSTLRCVGADGVVTVGARQKQASEGGYSQYELFIRGNGPHMARDELRRIQHTLDADIQAPDDSESLHGVLVARKLLRLMGGTLNARPWGDGGAEVVFTIPLQAAAHDRKVQFDSLFNLFSMLSGRGAVYLYDLRTQSVRFSPAMISAVGLPTEELSDSNGLFCWAGYIHPDDRERFMQALWDTAELRQESFDMNCRMRAKDGIYYRVRLLGSVTKDPEGQPDFLGVILESADLSEAADPVTGLPNLHRFLLALQQPYGSHAALLIHLGLLDRVNEIYGYSCGSEVLRLAGEMICKTVGDNGTVYRLDGARFGILSSVLGEEEMTELYETLRSRLYGSLVAEDVPHRLIAFGGLLIRSPERELSEMEAFSHLTGACNESERKLRGELVTIRESGAEGIDTPAVTRAIRRCMTNGFENFFLLYQPVFAPGSKRPIGAEALLRWRSEEYGELTPSRFLTDIERESSFRELGYWILRSAMADGAAFLEKEPRFNVCINVSPPQATDPYFAERLSSIAAQTRFPLDHLQLEVNRNCQFMPMDMLRSFAEPLRVLGVRIGIDDFGSGGGWLDALKSVHADYVKFSAEFTRGIAESDADREAVRHLSDLAGAYGAEVYFKAVESEGAAAALNKLTISGTQGWFFSQAVYYDEILEWLDQES